jgi:hypothetical protein
MRVYLNTSLDDMDYMSPTPLIICFTSKGRVIKINLIEHSPFSQEKSTMHFVLCNFATKTLPLGSKRRGSTLQRGTGACWLKLRQEDRFLMPAMSSLLGVKPSDSKEDLQSAHSEYVPTQLVL